MSRAYRIKVRESVRRVVRAEDHVSCELEILEILPGEQMAAVLADELAKQGFKRNGDVANRKANGTTIAVDLKTGGVTVRAEKETELNIEGEKTGIAYEESGTRSDAAAHIRTALRKELEEQARAKSAELQKQITDSLEAQLNDLRAELEGAVNRATAQALKQKAAQLGQIKTITEDPAAGTLTIVVEV